MGDGDRRPGLGAAAPALAASLAGGALLCRRLFFPLAPFGLEAGAFVLASAVGDEDGVRLQPAAFLLHRALGVARPLGGAAGLPFERLDLDAGALGGGGGLACQPCTLFLAGAFGRGCRFGREPAPFFLAGTFGRRNRLGRGA